MSLITSLTNIDLFYLLQSISSDAFLISSCLNQTALELNFGYACCPTNADVLTLTTSQRNSTSKKFSPFWPYYDPASNLCRHVKSMVPLLSFSSLALTVSTIYEHVCYLKNNFLYRILLLFVILRRCLLLFLKYSNNFNYILMLYSNYFFPVSAEFHNRQFI